MAERRCNQCWQSKPLSKFVGKRGGYVQNCSDCRDGAKTAEHERRTGVRRRRAGLDVRAHSRVIWVEESKNRKLGPIPSTLVAAGTCPKSCPFWGRGCYAEYGLTGAHWKKAAKHGLDRRGYLTKIGKLPKGQLWRWAVAGDLPGPGERLDYATTIGIMHASWKAGAVGFTFTHKPLTAAVERATVRASNASGNFTINLSANSLEHADELAKKELGPVVVVLPSDTPDRGTVTPDGRRVIVCPYETKGITCEKCRLCALPKRKAIVGFRAHGQSKRRVSLTVLEDGKARAA